MLLNLGRHSNERALARPNLARNEPECLIGCAAYGNHDWLLANERKRFMRFSFTQRKRLRLNGNRALYSNQPANEPVVVIVAAAGDDDDDIAGYSSEFAACISQLSDSEQNQISNILA